MEELSFDRDDIVEAAGGRDPWVVADGFTAEIRPDRIREAAAQYARGANEAHGADEVARRASEQAAEGGEVDGSPLADPDERTDETHEELGKGGQDADEVADLIVKAARCAEEAVGEVKKAIDALDGKVSEAREQVMRSWARMQARYSERVASQKAEFWLFAGTGDVRFRGTPVPGGGFTYRALEELDGKGFRDEEVADLGFDARATYTTVQDAIKAYRVKLAGYATELIELGPNVDIGPFALFVTPEIAELVAERLHKELSSFHPDPNLVELYTEGLATILGVLVEPDGDLVPGARLSTEQRDYLSVVLGALTPRDLVALGRFEPDAGLGNPLAAGVQNAVMQRVANAINLLMNPAAGGYDVSGSGGANDIPPGVRRMLDVARNATGERPLYHDLPDWDAFGTLMSHANLAPDDTWGRHVTDRALEVQDAVMNQYLISNKDDIRPSTGSSDLLGMVSLNRELSADLINDDAFFERLVDARWADATGAGKLFINGTTLPPGMDPDAEAAEDYTRAAYRFLTYSADHPDLFFAESDVFTPHQFDHTSLRVALGEIMGDRMEALSKTVPDNELGTAQLGLFDKDVHYSFGIDMETRMKLFGLMKSGDETTWGDFVEKTTQWAREHAGDLFRQTEYEEQHAGTNTVSKHTTEFEYIGNIMGSLANTETFLDGRDPVEPRHTAGRSIAAALGSVATGLRFGTPAGALMSVATIGVPALIDHLRQNDDDDPLPQQWDLATHGDTSTLLLLANELVAADYKHAGDVRADRDYEILSMKDGLENAKRMANDVGSQYAPDYFDAAKEGFDTAVSYPDNGK
ncbi:hypothetical protein [Streptomyces sp. NPDC049881]|uniref:putative alpha/beta hydrolase n=1 Tax=Streptomyces sp. NPDC049881 TaxID=3155778 RepID=UPI003420712A